MYSETFINCALTVLQSNTIVETAGGLRAELFLLACLCPDVDCSELASEFHRAPVSSKDEAETLATTYCNSCDRYYSNQA